MALIKCKMCGGDLRLEEGSTVCECEYCGTRQTVPSADNEKKLTLFSRAGRLLRGCEFDKAAGVFETIVADFPEEAEAYWGLVLCKYGIEYVDDPATGKKIPTCHRSSFDSVLDDPNFEQACENTDAIARRVYRDEARQIEDLRKRIIEVSGKEEPYDVFISYKETGENGDRSLDSVIAQDIYTELTEKGYRVFFSRISLEDKLGTEYEPYIFAALNSAKVMLVVGTDYENFDSVWVKNEWSRFLKLIASGQKKTLIPVFKNMDAYDMPKEFAKLAAQDMNKVGAMQDIIRGVEKLIGKKSPAAETVKETVVVQQGGGPNVTALLKRGQQALEDGEWEKAQEFFDRVLDEDAENAEAFFGLFLADMEFSNGEEYIEDTCSQEAEVETLSISPNTERIETAVRQYTIKNYLSEDEIRSLFRYDLHYPSMLKAWQVIAEEEQEMFTTDRNLARAVCYAKDNAASRPIKFKAELSAALEKTVREAQERERAAEESKRRDYEDFLSYAEGRTKQMHQGALDKKENDYLAAVQMFEQAKNLTDYQSVKTRFLTLAPYKDSAEMVNRCKEETARIKREAIEEAERKRKAEAEEAERQRLERARAAKAAAAKKKRTVGVVLALAVAAVAAFLIYMKFIVPGNAYKDAEALLADGDNTHAAMAFYALGDYRDARERSFALWDEIIPRKTVAAGSSYTVGLKADRGVIATEYKGDNEHGQCNVSGWMDIVAVAAGYEHTVGLKADGSLVVVGDNKHGQCNVSGWTDIVAIAAGGRHTVGLKADGTVLATGYNNSGQCNVADWTNIVAIAAGGSHTVGLRADGTVVAVGYNDSGRCNVADWTDVVDVAAGYQHTVGLKADGTVVAVGYNNYSQCDISGWTGIVDIAAGIVHTVGLKADGSLVVVGDNEHGQCNVSGWTDIVAIAAGYEHTVGLKADGSVVAVGNNDDGQCNVSGWTDIKLPNT